MLKEDGKRGNVKFKALPFICICGNSRVCWGPREKVTGAPPRIYHHCLMNAGQRGQRWLFDNHRVTACSGGHTERFSFVKSVRWALIRSLQL